jgi:hypothetical protein
MGNPQPSPIDRCLPWDGTDAVHRLDVGGGVIDSLLPVVSGAVCGLLGSLHLQLEPSRVCCDTVSTNGHFGSSPIDSTDSFLQFAPP